MFRIPGYTALLHWEPHENGVGLVAFIREDIRGNNLSYEFFKTEGLYLKINLHNEKLLLNCSYISPKNINMKVW